MNSQNVHIVKIEHSISDNEPKCRKNIPHGMLYAILDSDMDKFSTSDKITSNTSLFEIIGNKCIPFFDINNIPRDSDINYIFSIADTLQDELTLLSGVPFCGYAVTYNNNSLHYPGKSYHVYFPDYVTTIDEMVEFCKYYQDNQKNGYQYINSNVYKKDNIFRLPYQKQINKENENYTQDELSRDFHYILYGIEDPDEYMINNVFNKDMVYFHKTISETSSEEIEVTTDMD